MTSAGAPATGRNANDRARESGWPSCPRAFAPAANTVFTPPLFCKRRLWAPPAAAEISPVRTPPPVSRAFSAKSTGVLVLFSPQRPSTLIPKPARVPPRTEDKGRDSNPPPISRVFRQKDWDPSPPPPHPRRPRRPRRYLPPDRNRTKRKSKQKRGTLPPPPAGIEPMECLRTRERFFFRLGNPASGSWNVFSCRDSPSGQGWFPQPLNHCPSGFYSLSTLTAPATAPPLFWVSNKRVP